jgi:cell wall-associated NlpC family hydrolase
MISAEDVIDQARQWTGVRFLHQGRTRFGADCLGFIAAMLAELNSRTFIDFLPKTYGRSPQTLLIEGLAHLTREIPLQPGALILFQWPMTSFPSHAAIYTGENMIHSYQTEGKVVEHGYRDPWVRRAAGFWALPEVVYSK